MLSNKDKKWIQETITKSIKEALTIEWTIEKVRDNKTGQPLAVHEKKTENVFIPSMILQLLPYHEGALRGMQEDLSKNNNKINEMETKISTIGSLILQTEQSLKCLASLSDHIKQLPIYDSNLIEHKEE